MNLVIRRLALALALLCPTAFAAPLPAAPDLSAGQLDRAALSAAAKVTPAAFPDADDVVVDEAQTTWYSEAGASVTWDDVCVKVLTEKGKRDMGSLSFRIQAAYGGVEVTRLEILKSDGRTVPVDLAAQSRTSIAADQMGANIYDPNSKVLQVGVPGLEIGDAVRYVSRRHEEKMRIPDTWSDFTVFESPSPILHMTYDVWAPTNRPLRSRALKAEVAGTVTYTSAATNGCILHHWEARNVPRIFEEPDMPAYYTVVQRLIVSTLPDWQTVSRWYWNLCRPHLEATPEMKAKVEELTRGKTAPMEKVQALFGFVSQQVRYMGITTETEAPGYEPHDARTTFENRYGVCRDKAALLAALLRVAGLEGFPVIVHVGPKKDIEVPAPLFNHAIAAVRLDGKYILMDPTAETTRELMPAYLCDRSYLVATPEGETLLTSPIIPPEQNLVRAHTAGALDARGGLKATTTLDFEGINDHMYRSRFAHLKAEDRRRFFEGAVKTLVPGARLTGFALTPADMQDRTQPMKVRLDYEAADTLVAGEHTAMISPPWFGAAMGVVNFVLGATGLEQRKYPLVTDYACGVDEDFALEVGAAVGPALSLPETPPLDTDTLHWSQTLAASNGVLRGQGRFLTKTVEFSPAQYAQLKADLKTIEFNRRTKPVFAARNGAGGADGGGADVLVLDSSADYRVRDAHTWEAVNSTSLKILTYAGVKERSEVKVGYNPAWESVKIENVRITTRDGQVKTLAEKELNLMDAGWTASAPRYPAEKTLVASLAGVEVGATVEYTIRRSITNRPFSAVSEVFATHDPIRRKSLRVRMPAALAPRIVDRTAGQAEVGTRREGAETVYEWTVENRRPLRKEASLPPGWELGPSVFVSLGDWKTYAAEVDRAFRAAAHGQREAARRARELVKGAKGDEARIERIRDFVARQIRAAGPGFTSLPLAALTPADTSLKDGYANDADQAILLSALLEGAGFRPEFVLASSYPAALRTADPLVESPQRTLFGSVLVRVALPAGRVVYLNDTDQYARLGTTGHDGRLALDLPGGGVTHIEAPADRRDRVDTAYELRLDATGAARIEMVRTYRGGPFAEFRQKFSELPPEERRRYHQELVASISQSAVAEGELTTDYTNYPGVERFAVKAARYAVRDGGRMYFSLPQGDSSLPGLRADDRENPLYWDSPRRGGMTFRVFAPPEFGRVELAPPDLAWRTLHGSVECATVARPADGAAERPLLEVSQQTDLQPALFPVSDYGGLLDINRQLSHRRMRTVMLTAEPAAK